ncbi:hypothetical protein GB937_009931, partial [Aspergillus fischeri]
SAGPLKEKNGLKYLVHENGLDTQPAKKIPEKKFHLGFQRIQVCVFNSLAMFTVCRRSALLSLQCKDLQIFLQKDPHGGPPVPLIELTAEGVKKFLGQTKL